MSSKSGSALISVLAISAIVLLIISVLTVTAIINRRMNLIQLQAQQTFEACEGLAEEAILRFIRQRNYPNPYPDWTQNCLQINGFDCKMELDLNEDGGTIDIWGKTVDKVRHLQLELEVDEDQRVILSAKREL